MGAGIHSCCHVLAVVYAADMYNMHMCRCMYMDACSASDEFPHELFPSLLLHAWIRQRDYSDALSKHVCAELVVCAKAGYVSVAVDGARGEGCESRSTSHKSRGKE